MLFDKNEMQSIYDKPFIFGVSKCFPITDLRIGHVSLAPFTAIPSHREPFSRGVRRLGNEGRVPGSVEGRSHLHLRLHFNPQLHPSTVMWQWQNIPRILHDCWGVWHLSLAMKWNFGDNAFFPLQASQLQTVWITFDLLFSNLNRETRLSGALNIP